MAKLIDDIRAGATLTSPGPAVIGDDLEWLRYRDQVRAWIKDHDPVPVLLLDEVAEYVYTHHEGGQQIKLPNVAPPYGTFWTEFHTNFNGAPAGLLGDLRRVGVLATVCEWPSFTPHTAKWALGFHVFLEGSRDIWGPGGILAAKINNDGGVQGFTAAPPLANAPNRADVFSETLSFIIPTLVAVCFLHCKNVSTVEHVVSKPLADKYHKRTGIWPTRYRTLVIDPLKQMLRTEGRVGEVGLERALHICRGHFATYSEEGKGLFGRGIYGQVWVPQHLRGTRKSDQEGTPPREVKFKLANAKE